jgi:hypothetical protein
MQHMCSACLADGVACHCFCCTTATVQQSSSNLHVACHAIMSKVQAEVMGSTHRPLSTMTWGSVASAPLSLTMLLVSSA